MTRRTNIAVSTLALALGLGVAATLPSHTIAASDVPTELSDQEFWSLTERLSEPGGVFPPSDNLVSDEMIFSAVVPSLRRTIAPGGVYLGVGPEQNFTYIAAIKPTLGFIIDVRRRNWDLHLLYKALFELSANRAEFVSRLFTKPEAAGLNAGSTANDLMNAYWQTPSSDVATYERNLREIDDLLVRKHRYPLTQADLEGIGDVYHAFYWCGPSMTWSATSTDCSRRASPTYDDLMRQNDAGSGVSYLATDAAFLQVKDLERRNAVVPIVGDFAGPTAIRSIGAYLRARQATVSVFYVDEVEAYLRTAGGWPKFCANVATLPLDHASVFIRPPAGTDYFAIRPTGALLAPITPEVKDCAGGH